MIMCRRPFDNQEFVQLMHTICTWLLCIFIKFEFNKVEMTMFPGNWIISISVQFVANCPAEKPSK